MDYTLTYREAAIEKRERQQGYRETIKFLSGKPHDPDLAWEAQMRMQDENFIRHMLKFQEFRKVYIGELLA
jgi:polyhydroxyalkanoate synthesis regulator protein